MGLCSPVNTAPVSQVHEWSVPLPHFSFLFFSDDERYRYYSRERSYDFERDYRRSRDRSREREDRHRERRHRDKEESSKHKSSRRYELSGAELGWRWECTLAADKKLGALTVNCRPGLYWLLVTC